MTWFSVTKYLFLCSVYSARVLAGFQLLDISLIMCYIEDRCMAIALSLRIRFAVSDIPLWYLRTFLGKRFRGVFDRTRHEISYWLWTINILDA
jgi:hypothetical protein